MSRSAWDRPSDRFTNWLLLRNLSIHVPTTGNLNLSFAGKKRNCKPAGSWRRCSGALGATVGAKMTRAVVLGIVYILIGLLDVIAGQPSQQTCPPIADISPCVCQVKKNGLDILCEATDVSHINKAMQTLKSRNPIIFYLKLRHNNLPKLQGFFFLSLDIRHLTVHNSSLAAIEETALSSLGEWIDGLPRGTNIDWCGSVAGKGLTQLDVSQNQLGNIPTNAVKNLHNLLIFNLNHNRISVIHNRAFDGLDTLEILTIYENKVTSVEPEAFRGLEKYEYWQTKEVSSELQFNWLSSSSCCLFAWAGNWNAWTWEVMN